MDRCTLHETAELYRVTTLLISVCIQRGDERYSTFPVGTLKSAPAPASGSGVCCQLPLLDTSRSCSPVPVVQHSQVLLCPCQCWAWLAWSCCCRWSWQQVGIAAGWLSAPVAAWTKQDSATPQHGSARALQGLLLSPCCLHVASILLMALFDLSALQWWCIMVSN